MQASQSGRRRGVLIGGFIALLVVVLGMVYIGRAAPGVIAAPQTVHDFGEVPIDGGVVTTVFPVAINGSVRVTELSTT